MNKTQRIIGTAIVGFGVIVGATAGTGAAFAAPGAASEGADGPRDVGAKIDSGSGPRDVGQPSEGGSSTFKGGQSLESGSGPIKPAPPIRYR